MRINETSGVKFQKKKIFGLKKTKTKKMCPYDLNLSPDTSIQFLSTWNNFLSARVKKVGQNGQFKCILLTTPKPG